MGMSEEMIKTLEEIISAEKKMKERFILLAKRASTPEMRALFQEMAKDEEGHEKELTQRLTAIRFMRD
jgi:rubrerythrin